MAAAIERQQNNIHIDAAARRRPRDLRTNDKRDGRYWFLLQLYCGEESYCAPACNDIGREP